MKILRVGILVAFVISTLTIDAPTVRASESGNVIISQVQVGNASSSRLIELYNNSDTPVDVTGWCVRYLTVSGTASNRVCFTGTTLAQRLVLPSWSYILIGSSQLGVAADFYMAEGLGTGSVGSVYVVDDTGLTKDAFGWGATTYAEGAAKASDSQTKVYERRLHSPGVYYDEGNNSTDFYNSDLRTPPAGVYRMAELVEVIDVCLNIAGLQEVIPNGLLADADSQCGLPPADICSNIEGAQLVLPQHTEVDDQGNCYLDACSNIAEFQIDVPLGYMQDEENICEVKSEHVYITEILPNPDGEDAGNEFIELYNPNDWPVDVSFHVFHLNGDYVKEYRFKEGTVIDAQSYHVVRSGDLTPSFTLTNTQGSVRFTSASGQYMADVAEYVSAKSGESWALVDGLWQYTPFVTPGAANALPQLGQGAVGANANDCGEGRERNPATNRCRNIPVASVPTPCKEGQYRSEETNRCRSIATEINALKPCADNQFRNPATNRCKTIASTDDLTDCGEGRERNPATNRCRNVLGVTSVPEAAFKVEKSKDTPLAFVGWWALGGLALVAAGYAGWEWRREVISLTRSVVSRFSGKVK